MSENSKDLHIKACIMLKSFNLESTTGNFTRHGLQGLTGMGEQELPKTYTRCTQCKQSEQAGAAATDGSR